MREDPVIANGTFSNYYLYNSTNKKLKSYGIKIYRSDEMGMVKIVYYGNKNYIFIHNNP